MFIDKLNFFLSFHFNKMLTKSSINYVYKQLNYILNKDTLLILILLIISMSIFLCINENFDVSKTKNKTINLDTYYFRTEKQKKDGLMYIKKPLGNRGALFKYSSPQQICVWMKNTFIALDAIILDNEFKIIEFVPNLKPEDLTTKCSKVQNASYFIEVDAGFINKNKLNIGDKIICNEISFNLVN